MAAMTKRKLIIDCDPGTDDAQAILMALADKDTEVVAITVVVGNTSLDNATRNALRLLKYFNITDVPVYKGCSNTLMLEPRGDQDFHGPDGFGGITIHGVDPVDLGSVSTEHASVALCRMASADPGNITLVATGPLTNVAVALMLDTEFGKKLKDCVIMGGNYKARGNVSPAAEFNWFTDPEAANNVFANINRTITMLPLETCHEHSFPWDWYNSAIDRSTRAAWFLRSISAATVDLAHSRYKADRYWVCDQFAMAVFLNPAVIVESHEVYVTVELHGRQTRGQAVVDWNGSLGKQANVKLVTKIDRTMCEKMVLTAFTIM